MSNTSKRVANLLCACALLGTSLGTCRLLAASAQEDDYHEWDSVEAQHAKDKRQIRSAVDELKELRSRLNNAASKAQELQSQVSVQQNIKEFDITAKECSYEFAPGIYVNCLGYNGQVPGPVIRVGEGDPVRVVLHNKLAVPTSLYFQGIPLPHNVDGLPRGGAGLIAPGQTYTYQFMAPHAGIYWYHPQIVHGDQQDRGLFGALIVESKEGEGRQTSPDRIAIISKWITAGRSAVPHSTAAPAQHLRVKALSQKECVLMQNTLTYYVINGKSAPFIPALEVNPGEHIKLAVINTTADTIPLSLTGHTLQLAADTPNPPPASDIALVPPASTSAVEFLCDNPGIWSLGSLLPYQNETRGDFPGGIARVVRYTGFAP